mgnify:CR=1 FL=1
MDLLEPTLISKHEAAITISDVLVVWRNRNKYTDEDIQYQHVRSMELVQELTRAMDIPAKAEVTALAQARWKLAGVGMVKNKPTVL